MVRSSLPKLLLCACLSSFGAASAAAQAESSNPEAFALFEESRELYREGRFAEAADRLERAYAIDPAPVLLYNLARARESNGDVDQAIDAYRRYLEEEPSTRDRGAIERRLETLERQRAERLAAENPREPPPPVVVVAPESGPSAWPWITLGVGGASLIAATLMGVFASASHDDAVAEPSFSQAVSLQDRAETFALTANVLFAAGGAIAIAGLVWGILDLASSGDDSERAENTLVIRF
jgi:tetratricopeptide (TPR) repeat protein